jgi:hypothetical protein
MKIDIIIDKLTPGLVAVATGRALLTTFSVASADDLASLKEQGWLFDWEAEELCYSNIYKLQLKDDDVIQGLVAAQVIHGAVYVNMVESAPHNRGPNKIYEGVGGHLFAIAIKLSLINGFGGYIYFDAKNTELVNHYSYMLGAIRVPTRIHQYRMEVIEETAHKLIEIYTLEGDLNVERS